MAVATELKSMDFMMFARASEGLTHFRGIVVSFAAMLLGGAFILLGLYFGASGGTLGRIMLFICWVIYAVIAGTGVSATGIMLLDRARSAPPRALADALVYGFICFLKACVIGLALVAVAIAVALIAAIIYFICKIPGVGPILLFFTHPVMILVAGLLAFLTSIFTALVTPALWDGDSVTQAVAKTIAILKQRAVAAVVHLLVMAFVTAVILGIIGAIVFPGYFSMTGIAAAVIGPNLGLDPSMMTNPSMVMMALSSGGQSGHVYAMMLDTAVLVMLCIATALQVQLMGINLVYLGISEGIDTAEAERMLKRQLDQAKAKADEAKQRALIAAERAKAAAQQARSASTPTLPPTAVNECPNCKSSISPEDAFCENCGHRLR